MQQRTYFLSYQNIIQFGCLTLPLLWLVTILFYAAGLSLPRVFMAFSLLFPEFEMSVHRKSTTNNNKTVKKAYIFHVPPVMQ